MGRQPEQRGAEPRPGPPTAAAERVRLTDQALVAVALARAGASGRAPTVLDLLAGLAAEPDGIAGRRLRSRASAGGALVERAATPPPGLGPLDAAIRRAARAAAPRAVATVDLLAAALEEGGEDLADVLAAAGVELADLGAAPAIALDGGALDLLLAAWGGTAGGETYGLGADADLSPAAALAVAQVRAAAGGAVELVLALSRAAEPQVAELDTDALVLRLERLLASGAAEAAGERWDAGLDAVLAAARTWRAGGAVGVNDLLRTVAAVGGAGPLRLLEDDEEDG